MGSFIHVSKAHVHTQATHPGEYNTYWLHTCTVQVKPGTRIHASRLAYALQNHHTYVQSCSAHIDFPAIFFEWASLSMLSPSTFSPRMHQVHMTKGTCTCMSSSCQPTNANLNHDIKILHIQHKRASVMSHVSPLKPMPAIHELHAFFRC
jgi:hypothetical protein